MSEEEQVPMGTADRVSRLEQDNDTLKALANEQREMLTRLLRVVCRMHDRLECEFEMAMIRAVLYDNQLYDDPSRVGEIPFPDQKVIQ